MFDLLEKAVDSAIASGAKYSDARILNSKSRSINARNGDIEDFNESESIGIGIRALVGSSWGFYSTYDLSNNSLINSAVVRSIDLFAINIPPNAETGSPANAA